MNSAASSLQVTQVSELTFLTIPFFFVIGRKPVVVLSISRRLFRNKPNGR